MQNNTPMMNQPSSNTSLATVAAPETTEGSTQTAILTASVVERMDMETLRDIQIKLKLSTLTNRNHWREAARKSRAEFKGFRTGA